MLHQGPLKGTRLWCIPSIILHSTLNRMWVEKVPQCVWFSISQLLTFGLVFTEIVKWSLLQIWFLEHFIPLLDVYFGAQNTHWVLFDLPLQSQLVGLIILIITLMFLPQCYLYPLGTPKIILFAMIMQYYFQVNNSFYFGSQRIE